MTELNFYLYFNEGFAVEEPRYCSLIKQLAFGSGGNFGLLVRVDPPCSGKRYGPTEADIYYLVLGVMFSGQSLFPFKKWPAHVRVFVPQIDTPELRDSISLAEVKMIAFGEIHQTPKADSASSPIISRREMERMAEGHLRSITFIGEQDGDVERVLKKKLASCFSSQMRISKAYLARVSYGESQAQNVALCLRGGEECAEEIVRCIDDAFRTTFRRGTSLDILFLSETQLLEISLVAKAFYGNEQRTD